MELPRQIIRIELLVVQFVDVGPGAVLALLAHRLADQLEAVGLRHQVGVERAGHIGDVDHLGAHRVADLERRHGARAADVVDLDLPLAGLVHPVDEALEILGELGLLGERRDGTQRHLLGAGRGRQQAGRKRGENGNSHGTPLCMGSQTAGMAALFLALSIEYNRPGRAASQTSSASIRHPEVAAKRPSKDGRPVMDQKVGTNRWRNAPSRKRSRS